MTLLIVFSILALVSGAAFAGGEGSHSVMGKIKSMFGGESAVFQHPQRLSKLIGSEVMNNKGEDLGEVSDLIADEDGRISYLILDRSRIVAMGSVGIGSKLVAIPMSAIAPRVSKDGKWNINLAKQTLDQAPTFTASNYPDFSNKNWQDQVRGYFEKKEGSSPSPNKGMMPSNEEKSSKPMNGGGY